MKKFITIAALLAAGTALSSAANVVTTFIDLSSSPEQTIGAVSIANGSITSTEAGDLYSVAGSHINVSVSFTFNLTLAQAAVDSRWPNALININKSGATAMGILYDSTGLAGNWNAAAHGTAVTWDTLYANQNAYTVGGDTYLALTATFSNDGTNVYDASGAAVFTDGSLHASAYSSLDSISISAREIPNVSVSSWTLSATEAGAAAASLQAAAVPEPSAFGLLAGIGALALVAARRRRFRK